MVLFMEIFPCFSFVAAVNYFAVSDALQLSPSILAAGVAADNIICMVHLTILFTLAANIPPETSTSVNGNGNKLLNCMLIML